MMQKVIDLTVFCLIISRMIGERLLPISRVIINFSAYKS